MSRYFNSILVNENINLSSDSILYNNAGNLFIDNGGYNFQITSSGTIGPTGSIGNTGSIGPTGPAGPLFNVQIISTGSTLNPTTNVSVLSSGTGYTLSNSSTNGILKYVVDDVDRNLIYYIKKWNGTSLTSLSPALINNFINASVSVLLTDLYGSVGPTGSLYMGGSFGRIGNLTVNRIARWDGSQWFPLATGLGVGTVSTLAIDPVGIIGPTGNLYAGGSFTTTDGLNRIARWDGTTWSPLGTGMGNNSVLSLVIDPLGIIGPTGNLYAGGNFTTAGETAANRIARWDGTGWSPLSNGLGAIVRSVIIDTLGVIGPTGNLYAGGDFTTAGNTAANRIARWDGTTWYPLGTGVTPGSVNTLVIDQVGSIGPTGNLYAGGNFTTAGETAANRIARWNGTTWFPLGTGMGNNSVNSLIINTNSSIGPIGNLYAGGAFTTAGGTAANRIARWNGTTWFPLGSGISINTVNSLEINNNELILGGSFTEGPTLPTITTSGNFYSATGNIFYTSIRTTSSYLGKQQGLVYLNNVGAWSIINNNEIFSYV